MLRINELILEDRVRAKELTERLAQGQSVTPDDQAWLTELAVKYKVLESTSERLDSDAFAELNALAVKHTDDHSLDLGLFAVGSECRCSRRHMAVKFTTVVVLFFHMLFFS
jgi:hypothetical protein